MKNATINSLMTLLTWGSLFFLIETGCSSDKPSANEETAPPMEENTTAEEPAEAPQDTSSAPEVDMQVSNTDPQPIQPPQDKKPVLTMMSTSYKDWNVDGNNVLDKEEFYQGMYQVWDTDKDEQISNSEFTEGANQFFADYNFKEYGKYDDWDTDHNSNISVAEFREGMKNTVDQDPTAQELLVIWDTDNDDAIERIELDNITVRLDEDSN